MHKNVLHMLSRYDADEDKYSSMRTTKGQTADQIMTNSDVKFTFKNTVRKLVTLKHDINEQSYVNQFTPLILPPKVIIFLLLNIFYLKRLIQDQKTDMAIPLWIIQQGSRIKN
ncbi:unnamed protein product [Paramecium sonneborni]|uniref:Uncharacterized protein n=1 Tax=Paramecium sonneborni TaxID=65129 RepID=A0A8S1JUN3_9CILI|nr:unnamed protein product [Paramecium sonneborni]